MTQTLALFALFQDAPLTPAPHSSALADILHNSGPVAFAVLILLAAASVFSWTIIIAKYRAFAAARGQSARFLRAFRRSGRLSEIAAVAEQFKPSPLVAVFAEINDEYQRQTNGRGLPRNPVGLERAGATGASEALTNMELRITWLATIGNIAPFVGLFGTVWGIIDAFHGLGTAGAATLRAVAPGISEALITTAAGILVAIPAVVGYNQLTAQLRDFAARMDDFGRELLNAIENAAAFQPPAPPEAPLPMANSQERRRF
jgi:biopolymer transport protein TolQ